MILRRCGGKSKYAAEIQMYFPPHSIYIEPFFGAGGMFFNKPKAKYNFLNDIDNEVYNLFMVVKTNRQQLYDYIYQMPIHQQLLRYWKENEESDPVWRAVRFLFLSNFTYLSKGDTLKFTADNTKQVLLSRIEPTFQYMKDARFLNVDFREVFNMIIFKTQITKKSNAFIYSDGPYFGTDGNYTFNSNSEQDVIDHMNLLQESDIRFAMSEFNSEFILDQAAKRGLVVNSIVNRVNLKNRRTEILITNFYRQFNLFNNQNP